MLYFKGLQTWGSVKNTGDEQPNTNDTTNTRGNKEGINDTTSPQKPSKSNISGNKCLHSQFFFFYLYHKTARGELSSMLKINLLLYTKAM